MSLKLKNRKRVKLSILTTAGLTLVVLFYFTLQNSIFCENDYRILDRYYKQIVKYGYGPKATEFPEIKYVTITDATYAQMGKNFLDRLFLSQVNSHLVELGVEAIIYDIIFSYPTTPESDLQFAKSIEESGNIYLPIGTNMSSVGGEYKITNSVADQQLDRYYLKAAYESGIPKPFFGTHTIGQLDLFAEKINISGHISVTPDSDGYFRHIPTLIKINNRFLPTLSLAVFLDYMDIPFEAIDIEWGKQITIPALEDSFLEKDVIIPINKKGQTYIPYSQTWEDDFEEIPAHLLLESFNNTDLKGNLAQIFEGNFIFVGDISTGISDIGPIPIQNNVPLIMMHSAMLNGLLTNTFYSKWTRSHIIGLIIIIGLMAGISAIFQSSRFLYAGSMTSFLGVTVLTFQQFSVFSLAPIVSLWGITVFICGGLIITIQITTSRDRSFIKEIFARYVPEKVVSRLLMNPEMVKLGGETRHVSILMSDLRGFTALCETQSPEEVIIILNRYLEIMIDIIMEHYGVLDEIIGDGILAFFGAPEEMKDHPTVALACALAMQKAMKEINLANVKDGLPQLEMGIGINSGDVVIGNIGSTKRTKYGLIGSEVNFTGRIESYTVGGQVLISESTYEQINTETKTGDPLHVKMKGMNNEVTLYPITQIGEPYNIHLENLESPLVKIESPLNIQIFSLDDKIVTKNSFSGLITHLSHSSAQIKSSIELNLWTNIRFNISILNKDIDTTVYAKVTSILNITNDHEMVIRFTSVCEQAKNIFENHLTNRKPTKTNNEEG